MPGGQGVGVGREKQEEEDPDCLASSGVSVRCHYGHPTQEDPGLLCQTSNQIKTCVRMCGAGGSLTRVIDGGGLTEPKRKLPAAAPLID